MIALGQERREEAGGGEDRNGAERRMEGGVEVVEPDGRGLGYG